MKQESAKAILATKICTHFNRIKRYQASPDTVNDMVGSIKNNVLMIGPTGVGKTYMIKLIAKKNRRALRQRRRHQVQRDGLCGG